MLISIIGTAIICSYPDNSEVLPNTQIGEIIGYTPKSILVVRTEPTQKDDINKQNLPQPTFVSAPMPMSGLGIGPPPLSSLPIANRNVSEIFTVDEFRDIKISAVKRYSANVIESKYPIYKQVNIMREGTDSEDFTEMTTHINNCRDQSNIHEDRLKALNGYEAIGAYNIYETIETGETVETEK